VLIPMLPVTHGVEYTRWQMLLYTVLLVYLATLLPWATGMSGLFYLGGALVLGWRCSSGYALAPARPARRAFAMKERASTTRSST
jgi:heme o synthase